jgi:DNA-binding response OmpR family regulator
MRGTVLIVDAQRLQPGCAEHLRADGLLVYEPARAEDAFEHAGLDPDVVVIGPGVPPSRIRELRTRVDHAASMILVDDVADYMQARDAGVDAIVKEALLPGELLNETRRAVILRRSGRRLPWNHHQERAASVRGWLRCRKSA